MGDEATTITGGCLCGAVRFEVSAPPLFARTCWCRLCQHIGAGGPSVNVGFPSTALRVEGELRDFSSLADSGNRMHRHFCPRCGSHIYVGSEARPWAVVVRAGALDDPEIAQPSMTIWTAEAPGWACIDADLPQVPGQPAPPPNPA
jgi:hypothetical protein